MIYYCNFFIKKIKCIVVGILLKLTFPETENIPILYQIQMTTQINRLFVIQFNINICF